MPGAALMRAEDLTKTLDLNVLTSDVTEADIERACARSAVELVPSGKSMTAHVLTSHPRSRSAIRGTRCG